MRKSFKPVWLLLLFVCIVLINGCKVEKLGTDLGSGLSSGISKNIDSLGARLVAGMVGELSDPKTKKKISGLLDSIAASVSSTLGSSLGRSLRDSVSPKIVALRDSLINTKILRWADSLVDILTGSKLRLNVEVLQAALIGKTKTDVLQMRDAFQQLLNDILSDDTKGKLGAIRDELLGAKTDSAISRIVNSAMTKVIERYNNDLNPVLKEDLSFVSRHAVALLLTLGGVAALMIGLIWWNRQKYLRMSTLLAKNIHDIPDQQVYDQVTGRIKNEAVSTGLEPDLRKILDKNGLLDSSKWKTG